MALLASPDVGVCRRTLLRTVRLAFDWPEQREFARANLADFKAPHNVIFVNELPKTASGKIQKYILRAQRPAIAPQ